MAYKLLLQRTSPSWLYPVKHGATTISESWDGIREDGTVHDSLNHYSYGAISGFLMDTVCGIRFSCGKLVIAPKPDKSLGFAKGIWESPVGTIESSWHYEGKQLTTEVTVPANMTADLRLPDTMPVWSEDPVQQEYYSRYVTAGVEAIMQVWAEHSFKEDIETVFSLAQQIQKWQLSVVKQGNAKSIS